MPDTTTLAGQHPTSQDEDLLHSGPFAPDNPASPPLTPRTPSSPPISRRNDAGAIANTGDGSILDLAHFLLTTGPPAESLPSTATSATVTNRGKGLAGHVRTRSTGGHNKLVKRALKVDTDPTKKDKANRKSVRLGEDSSRSDEVPKSAEERISSNGESNCRRN